MELVHVDVVGIESSETGIEIGAEVAGDVAVGLVVAVGRGRCSCVIDVVAELGRDDDLVAPSGEGPAEHSLAVPGAVVGSCVEEGDSELERPVEGTQGLGVVDLAPAGRSAVEGPRTTDRPAAEPEGADLDPDRPSARVENAVMGLPFRCDECGGRAPPVAMVGVEWLRV